MRGPAATTASAVPVRLYSEADGRLRFASKDPETERAAAREILTMRRETHERLFVQNMALLGEPTELDGRPREVLHAVRDESDEELWREWRAYCAQRPGEDDRFLATATSGFVLSPIGTARVRLVAAG